MLEHETEAIEVFEEWKKFAEGKISEQQLNKFLDGAKVNLVPKGFDALLKQIQKETGARGKARYADPRAQAYLNKSKNNIKSNFSTNRVYIYYLIFIFHNKSSMRNGRY